jgi:hypothetical protein
VGNFFFVGGSWGRRVGVGGFTGGFMLHMGRVRGGPEWRGAFTTTMHPTVARSGKAFCYTVVLWYSFLSPMQRSQ